MAYSDALRGYAYAVLKRDGFKCCYCGLDGMTSFDRWLCLSWDHLLPKGHPERDNEDYIVAACLFCNVADNQYFRHAEKRGLVFDGLTREELVEQRRPYVMRTRDSYREFWEEKVGAATNAGRYWVYENWVAEQKAVIHHDSCGYCNDGTGCHENPSGERTGRWLGPFESLESARAAATDTDRPVKEHRCVT